ncbi:MAG: uroporphyrinogen decarboxylase family protein [Phycisphaerae bacterium]
MPDPMTRRERVFAALAGRTPDRIPRAYTAVPGFRHSHPGALERIEQRFPQDVADCGYRLPDGAVRGDPYAVGTYVDEWGCVFENIHAGVIGQVKQPVISSYGDLDTFKPPMHLIGQGMENVARTCEATDGFTLTPLPVQPFERMQFLRGTEALLRDLIRQPASLFKLRERVHEFNLAWVDRWCATPVHCLFIADDWGSQTSLLISPKLWRELFKPLYADYVSRAKRVGKFTYMHSDGYILDVLEDLIELGVDAVNAQVTCMDLGKLSQRFAGRITFWGQMDRQHMLCFGTTEDARRAARDFYDYLAAPNGSRVVAQMHIEPNAKPENIGQVLEEFERIALPGGAAE